MPFPLSVPMQKHPDSSVGIQRPVRILHVLGGLDCGGVETWLMRVLKLIDRERFQIDIMIHSLELGFYHVEARALGCRILPCLYPTQPWRYAAEFLRLLQEYGPYDVVHSNVHFFSGYILQLAKIAILQSATHGLATSQQSAQDLFGAAWRKDKRMSLLFVGLDLGLLETKVIPSVVRQEWGIPADAWVMGHVGRFETQKNHDFLVQIAAEVIRQRPNSYLMLMGRGSLQPQIEQQVEDLGIGDRVIFTGSRSDITAILLGAFDTFIFPSLHEGLGVALMEAQAAGLPCLISDVVPIEADVVPDLVKRLSLSQSSVEWANALLTHSQNTARKSSQETLPLLKESPFNMENSVPLLEALYSREPIKSGP
jgi:glycosyltransferase involved in cell wall biosynthesis